LCIRFATLETFLSRSRHVSLSRWLGSKKEINSRIIL
jgi:hypothetical protein